MAIVVGSGPQPVNADAGVVLGVAAGVGFFASIVLGAFLQSTGVRAIGISDRDITFGGVHENFIAAVEELRDERRAKRRERRLAEDAGDEDDDRPRRRRRSAENDDRD